MVIVNAAADEETESENAPFECAVAYCPVACRVLVLDDVLLSLSTLFSWLFIIILRGRAGRLWRTDLDPAIEAKAATEPRSAAPNRPISTIHSPTSIH